MQTNNIISNTVQCLALHSQSRFYCSQVLLETHKIWNI